MRLASLVKIHSSALLSLRLSAPSLEEPQAAGSKPGQDRMEWDRVEYREQTFSGLSVEEGKIFELEIKLKF